MQFQNKKKSKVTLELKLKSTWEHKCHLLKRDELENMVNYVKQVVENLEEKHYDTWINYFTPKTE